MSSYSPQEIALAKQLRSLQAMALNKALSLVRKHKGQIEACLEDFHQENIRTLSLEAACDEATASTFYWHSGKNTEKALEEINNQIQVIARNKQEVKKREIGFILWAEGPQAEAIPSKKRSDVFIPSADFALVMEAFCSSFPLPGANSRNKHRLFDRCGYNFYNKESIEVLLVKIKSLNNEDEAIARFKEELSQWLEDKLRQAEWLVVYGNL